LANVYRAWSAGEVILWISVDDRPAMSWWNIMTSPCLMLNQPTILSAYCHPIAMKNKTWISQDHSNPICTEILALPPATNCCRDHLILPVSTQPCPRLVRCCQRCSTCCQRGDLSQSLDGYVREVWINMGTERAWVYFQQKWDVTHKPGAASNM
jgi:hypothetical protein